MVSMVPFAIAPTIPALVLHVSALAAHTGNMTRHPAVSLLVMQPERAGEPVHALPRVTLHGRAETVTREDTRHATVRQAYLDRFPDTEPMMQLGDFRLLLVQVSQARQVAGVGVVGGHCERLGSGVVVQPGSGGGVGLFENVEEEAMQAAGGDVLALNGGAVWLEGDGDLLHV